MPNPLHLYDNFTRSLRPFAPLDPGGEVGLYKMEKGARRTGKTAWEIAQLYTDAFLADMKLLNIEDPTVLCRATDHIGEQIDFIADIERNGLAARRRA
jgi:hypothetical protein